MSRPSCATVAGRSENYIELERQAAWGQWHWNCLADAFGQRVHLPAPPALEQAEMDIDAMHCRQVAPELHHAMQQASIFESVRGNILIRLRNNRES